MTSTLAVTTTIRGNKNISSLKLALIRIKASQAKANAVRHQPLKDMVIHSTAMTAKAAAATTTTTTKEAAMTTTTTKTTTTKAGSTHQQAPSTNALATAKDGLKRTGHMTRVHRLFVVFEFAIECKVCYGNHDDDDDAKFSKSQIKAAQKGRDAPRCTKCIQQAREAKWEADRIAKEARLVEKIKTAASTTTTKTTTTTTVTTKTTTKTATDVIKRPVVSVVKQEQELVAPIIVNKTIAQLGKNTDKDGESMSRTQYRRHQRKCKAQRHHNNKIRGVAILHLFKSLGGGQVKVVPHGFQVFSDLEAPATPLQALVRRLPIEIPPYYRRFPVVRSRDEIGSLCRRSAQMERLPINVYDAWEEMDTPAKPWTAIMSPLPDDVHQVWDQLEVPATPQDALQTPLPFGEPSSTYSRWLDEKEGRQPWVEWSFQRRLDIMDNLGWTDEQKEKRLYHWCLQESEHARRSLWRDQKLYKEIWAYLHYAFPNTDWGDCPKGYHYTPQEGIDYVPYTRPSLAKTQPEALPEPEPTPTEEQHQQQQEQEEEEQPVTPPSTVSGMVIFGIAMIGVAAWTILGIVKESFHTRTPVHRVGLAAFVLGAGTALANVSTPVAVMVPMAWMLTKVPSVSKNLKDCWRQVWGGSQRLCQARIYE